MLAYIFTQFCIERALARVWPANPAQLGRHAGKVLRVVVGDGGSAGVTYALRVTGDGGLEAVSKLVDASATVMVPASRVLGDGASAVRMEGDSEFLADLASVAREVDWGADACVESLAGPLAGSVFANLRAWGQGLGQDSCERLGSTVVDFLSKEAKLLPEPAAVDRLRADVEGFASRVEGLRQGLGGVA